MAALTSSAVSTIGRTLHRIGLGQLSQAAKLLLRHRTVRITADGFDIAGPGSAFRMLRRIEQGDYEPQVASLLLARLRPGARVLDIGAAIGYYTLIASRAVGSSGAVWAFEADPYAARSLRRNIAANHGDNVQVIEKAVSAATGETRNFYLSTTTGHSGFAKAAGGRSTLASVTTVAIDDLNIEQVDVAKIDVEGAELGVLRGMRETLDRSPDISLFIEFNPLALRAAGTDPDELMSLLASRFTVQMIDGRGLTPFTMSATRTGYVDLLCSAM